MDKNSHHKQNHTLFLEWWDGVRNLNNWDTETEKEANGWLPSRGMEKSIAKKDAGMKKMDKIYKKKNNIFQ